MIQVKNLAKTFRVHTKEPGLKGSIQSLFHRRWIEKQALKGVSLDVRAGEIVGLVGPNGAGKTTLVKALAGIIHPTSGEAKVLGFVPWQRHNEFRRQIALIMGQKAQLWWDLPAADCFLLLRQIYQIPKKDFEATLDFLTGALQVKEQMKVQIRRLSLGERMKMELIAALLHQPKVVFLDEPTIGLDFSSQRAIRDFILDYRRDHGPAMIVTSHYMEDIERMCERLVLIREGEFVYDGSLKKFVDRYALHKVVTVDLDTEKLHKQQREGILPASLQALAEELGEILSNGSEQIRLKVARAKVKDAVSVIMQRFPVVDLSIDEEEVSRVIERVMEPNHRET